MTHHDRLKARLSSELRGRGLSLLSTFVPIGWSRADFASSIAWEDGLGECPADGAPGSTLQVLGSEDGPSGLSAPIPFAPHHHTPNSPR